jgi:hypothetical protein
MRKIRHEVVELLRTAVPPSEGGSAALPELIQTASFYFISILLLLIKTYCSHVYNMSKQFFTESYYFFA